jgi:hypothetical protein
MRKQFSLSSKTVWATCLILLLSGSVLLSSGLVGQYVLATFSGVPLYTEDWPAAASYIVKTDGAGYYWAVKSDGSVPYSGTNASQVIESCMDSLISGGSILLKIGTYPADLIFKNQGIRLIGEEEFSTIIQGSITIDFTGGYHPAYTQIEDLEVEATVGRDALTINSGAYTPYLKFIRCYFLAYDSSTYALYATRMDHSSFYDCILTGKSWIKESAGDAILFQRGYLNPMDGIDYTLQVGASGVTASVILDSVTLTVPKTGTGRAAIMLYRGLWARIEDCYWEYYGSDINARYIIIGNVGAAGIYPNTNLIGNNFAGGSIMNHSVEIYNSPVAVYAAGNDFHDFLGESYIIDASATTSPILNIYGDKPATVKNLSVQTYNNYP